MIRDIYALYTWGLMMEPFRSIAVLDAVISVIVKEIFRFYSFLTNQQQASVDQPSTRCLTKSYLGSETQSLWRRKKGIFRPS
jgi:hypothetical protein